MTEYSKNVYHLQPFKHWPCRFILFLPVWCQCAAPFELYAFCGALACETHQTLQLEMLSSKLAHRNHCFGTMQETCMYTQQLGLISWFVLVECLTLRLCTHNAEKVK
jgi:hypothetical protein